MNVPVGPGRNVPTLSPAFGAAVLLLAGCGTTGQTSRFTVPLEPETPVVAMGSLRVAPATMAPDACS